MTGRLAPALLLSLSLVAGTARAEGQAFDATGRATVSGGDRVRARQRALDDALAHAVEAAVAALMGPETLARRAADLRLKILPRARTYVTTYRVLEEGEVEAGFFDVHVSAEIAGDRLMRELADRGHDPRLPAPPGAPRRALLCLAGELAGAGRVEAAARALLAARGLEATIATTCDDDAIGQAVRTSGARAALVVELQAAAAEPIRGTMLVGRAGKLRLRVVEPGGRRSADGDADGAGYGASPAAAAEELALRALPEATAEIDAALTTLGGAVGTSGAIAARLVGVRRLPQLATLRAAIERLPGVESVELRRFAPGTPAGPGTIELQLRTAQPVRALVDAIGRVAAAYQVSVREVDGALVIEAREPLEPTGPPSVP